MKRRVVVTGLGVLAANGNGVDAYAQAIFGGQSGIAAITRFDASDHRIGFAAEVKNFDPADHLPIAVVRKTDRFSHLGLVAAAEALANANLLGNEEILAHAGVIIGSGLGGNHFHEEMMMQLIETNRPNKVAASSVPRITPNAVSAYIALHHKIKGPNMVISTACSSSANAIGEAMRKIRNGDLDVVLAGGVEAPVSRLNMAMYEAMMVLGKPRGADLEDASRPFDLSRNGFVMGEGGAILILESEEHARARGAQAIAEIAGYGSNCGAYHMVAPNPTGEDAVEAMALAVGDADMDLDAIDYIAAHGTSTKLNDLSETRAIKSLLGPRAYDVPVSSIKSMTGHTIGAAGAMQILTCCLAIRDGKIPPTINLNERDAECDLDYVPHQSRNVRPRNILSNSFGFGSNNAVIAIRSL